VGYWLVYVLAAIGAGILLLSAIVFVQTRRFVDLCLICDGKVVRFANDADGDPSYPVIGYEVGTGSYEIQLPMASPRPEIGTLVRVEYSPSDPGNAWEAGTVTPWVIPAVIAVAGVGIIVTAVVMAIN